MSPRDWRVSVPDNGLTPDARSKAIGRAKSVALHFARAVSTDDAHLVQSIRNGLSDAEFAVTVTRADRTGTK